MLKASCYFCAGHSAERFGHMPYAQLEGAPFTLYSIGTMIPVLPMRKLRAGLLKHLPRVKLVLNS